jgi:raffinose/stachyose/melibiose transport system substrate-binding protein
VKFQPIKNSEYDTALKTSLETGVGADIMILRSYDGGRQIYDAGYVFKLNDLVPNVESDFTANSVDTWSTEDGAIYGVPYFGSITGVWTNADIFSEHALAEPVTWDELIQLSRKLKNAGVTVFAHGTNEAWVLTETLLCDLGPNFYGGEKTRQRLLNKEIKYTDPLFVNAYEKMQELVEFFPPNYQAIDYVTMQQMFINGQAAMWIAGSWELGIIRDAGLEVGWFGPPVEKEGDRMQYAFYADLALGINKDTEHKEEGVEFLRWIATPEHASLLANELPGMFPPLKVKFDIEDPIALEIVQIAQKPEVDTTGQLTWEKLSRQEPSGTTLQREAIQKFLNGTWNAKQATEHVQRGLETWYF